MRKSSLFIIVIFVIALICGVLDKLQLANTLIPSIGILFLIYHYFFPTFPPAIKKEIYRSIAIKTANALHEEYLKKPKDDLDNRKKLYKSVVTKNLTKGNVKRKDIYGFRLLLIDELKNNHSKTKFYSNFTFVMDDLFLDLINNYDNKPRWY